MKRLFRHTSTLILRTALLLGVMIFVNTPHIQAQPVSITKDMPDAFETKTPVIGDGQYYFLQFYYELNTSPYLYQSFLGELGEGVQMQAMDYMPFAANRQWTLIKIDDTEENKYKFKLKSKRGFYAYYNNNRFYTTVTEANASVFTYKARGSYRSGFYELLTSDGVQMGRWSNGGEWSQIINVGSSNTIGYVRFAKLKSTAAHIIYYREEHADGEDNSSPNASTTRHYLTYSGTTDNEAWNYRSSTVSSRKSIIPSDKSLWTLPTAAAYHQDGLWSLEEIGSNGEFYIKKYGTEEYLNAVKREGDGFYLCDLGTKDDVYGKYVLETPNANRYTRIESKKYQTVDLAATDFYIWDGDGAGANSTGSASVDNNVGSSVGAGATVIGSSSVLYLTYANLTNYTNLLIEGTPGVQLRALFNRQGSNDGPLTEKNVTIGDDRRAIIDLTDLPYAHLNAIKTGWSSPGGTIQAISLVNLNSADATSPRYIHHSYGDGWQAMQWSGDDSDYWYAGFYPVEVPVPNKDEFFQVLLQLKSDTGLMVDYTGGATGYSEDPATRKLFQLEQVDDYSQFRLKTPTGQYLRPHPDPGGVTAPNDPTEADVISNLVLVDEKFNLKWFYVDPASKAQKEIPVKKGEDDLYMVTHKMSYLKQYAQAGLDKQGLATDVQSDWWNYDNSTQKVNHFEITHYVRKGNTITVEFPTVLNKNNDHIYFQRFYNYDEADASMDLENLKAHVSLDTRDDGNVQYFLYKNGMVTGQKLTWKYNDGTDIPDGGMARNEQRRFNFTNSDGNAFTVAADVSRYSDMTYEYPSSPQSGDLEEPSLTMRYIYYMRDAKVMAKDLTACTSSTGKWLESKEFHFPAKQVKYEASKKNGYKGEFIGLRHVFSDYWVYDDPNFVTTDASGNRIINTSYIQTNYNGGQEMTQDELDAFLDNHLVSAVNSVNGGKIVVEIPSGYNNPGIRLGGYNPNIDLTGTTEGVDADYQGFYFYDKVVGKTSYGDSRFIVFRYPSSGEVAEKGASNAAKINVYLENNGTRYQLAQYSIIFDENSETLPWVSVNSSEQVKGTDRDPENLVKKAGKPIAKVTFDYPLTIKNKDGDTVDPTYHFPDVGETKQGWYIGPAQGTLANSSPIPLKFDNTNYAFSGFECNWGSYSIVSEMTTNYGNKKTAMPADDNTYGYGVEGNSILQADAGMRKGFLYIDASEQPGDICAATFQGEFCASDKLMCSGWISGSNKVINDTRCPGGITLTVKGEDSDGKTNTIYRFCPGQCYELDNGDGGVDGNENSDHVVWQQFYFEFSTDKKYERYWLEVNNNCVSSNGGDFMLDNIEVYAYVPEVEPEMNTPLCVKKDGTTEMSLLKLKVNYNKLKSSANVSSGTTYLGFVFLEKDVFLRTLKQRKGLSYSLEELAEKIADGTYTIGGNDVDYRAAFNAALLRKDEETETVWKSDNSGVNKGSGVLYFKWDTNFESELMPPYSFYKAVNKTSATYRYTDSEGEPFLIMNGNFPELPWKTNTDYYIVPSNDMITSFSEAYSTFNICSDCSKASVFQLDPPYQLLSMEASEATENLVVCEGKIPTVLTNLKGYDMNGRLIPMTGLNFDWWLGDKAHGVVATLENYHSQQKVIGGETVKLDVALSTLRAYYKDATNLDGIIQNLTNTPNLTASMVTYLQELIDKGQLVLHQKSISIPAEKTSDEDPYFYLVACPIHDEIFDQALNPAANQYVSYFCDEPQGVRMKIGDKAPTLKCGFVPNENGFTKYDYSTVDDAVLSIRLAKKAQFMTVQHGEANEAPEEPSASNAETAHYLWLPIRNAETETASGVIRKSADYDVYLASTNDPTWDKNIYTAMSQTVPSLPVVGKIVQLTAINTKGNINLNNQNNENRLCIYFTSNFEVREGYSYTLSLPFQEVGDVNACDGTMLINLKIVPDYEVWTGAAGNTDWNNDENWRRADYDELYADNGTTLKDEGGTLQEYKTNAWNYRTPKDRLFRKGFAPLYCTHVLMMSDEWGNAPVLYDALDGADSFSASPFPNLRDADNWDGHDAEATATSILKFDMQARQWDIWEETYGVGSRTDGKGRAGDLLAEMYQINSCDEIAFQPATELRNAHLLNYNNAWVEYQLDMKRWYLLGSPLQGTIAGEWYAPSGTAQQKTTYYEPVKFGAGYDRYSPAIYQRSWDKAKAVLYEVGAVYSTEDNPNDLTLSEGNLPGSAQQGTWSGTTWNTTGADDYLDRLGYKPMSDKKANVAIKGVWSNTYNDATVDYTKGGFSVMVMNHLKNNDTSGDKAIIRLPKEDTMYDYYKFSETGEDNGGTDTNLSDVQSVLNRAKNRGRLKTDLLLPTSTQKKESTTRTYTRVPIKEADLKAMIDYIRNHQETVSAGISENMKFYLVENPFPCGLNMDQFFTTNTGLEKKYWLLTATGQHLVQKAASGDWITQSGGNFTTANAVVAPGQGFFVEALSRSDNLDIYFSKNMQAQTRVGKRDGGTPVTIEVGRSQVMVDQTVLVDMNGDGTPETEQTIQVPKTDGNGPVTTPIEDVVTVYKYTQDPDAQEYLLKARTRGGETNLLGLVITAQRGDSQSSALVMQRKEASNDFLPEEDTEVFINSDLEYVPTVYTLCGRLATTINSIHDFRSLPIGVESNSDALCTLTFKGVELLGDSVAFYDAVEQTLTPLESGMQVSVSGQTQNRYYLVRSLIQEEAAAETHLQIFTEGLTAKVIASTAEPIVSVRCFDTAGRLIHSASPQTSDYGFTLPTAGIYIIEAETENDHKTKKVLAK